MHASHARFTAPPILKSSSSRIRLRCKGACWPLSVARCSGSFSPPSDDDRDRYPKAGAALRRAKIRGFDFEVRRRREERELLHAARCAHRAGEDRRRAAARRGVRAPASHRRGVDARDARALPGSRLDPHAHPVAFGLRAGQEPPGRCRHDAPLHLYPRLPRYGRVGQARVDRLRTHAKSRCRRALRSRAALHAGRDQGLKLLAVGGEDYSLLADDAGDELGGGYVERRIAHRHAFGCPARLAVPGDLRRRTLLDRNMRAVGDAGIEGGKRGGDVERYAVPLREHGERVSADLVRDIAVRRDAVGADHDDVDLALAHKVAGHAVGNKRAWNTFLHELPGGKPRALQIRTRLVRDDRDLLVLRRANHAERCSESRGSERTGVAMSHDARALGNQLRAQAAQGAVGRQVFVVDRPRLGFEVIRLPHALERPEEIHRGGPALGEDLITFGRSAGQYDPERGRAANRRRTAYHHVPDRLRHLGSGTAGDVDRFFRKEPLIKKLESIAFPAYRLYRRTHTTRSLPPSTGTCAAVVLAKSGPHISAASSATSLDETSVLSRLRFLYCSTLRL